MDLTPPEREVMDLVGRAYAIAAEQVVLRGPNRKADLAELAAVVHEFQRAVAANAYARAHPTQFRPLGGRVEQGVRGRLAAWNRRRKQRHEYGAQ
jgi:hypothetical protein